jgi:hypothetical protein
MVIYNALCPCLSRPTRPGTDHEEPHYTAIIRETKTGQRWAVDSRIGDNGENPSITQLGDWYLKSAS